MTEDPEKPPFAGHRMYYLALKIALLVVALGLALRYLLG
jgi:hypothetical protein